MHGLRRALTVEGVKVDVDFAVCARSCLHRNGTSRPMRLTYLEGGRAHQLAAHAVPSPPFSSKVLTARHFFEAALFGLDTAYSLDKIRCFGASIPMDLSQPNDRLFSSVVHLARS